MTQSYRGLFSYEARARLGKDVHQRIPGFQKQLPASPSKVIKESFSWFERAHRMYVEAWTELQREEGEDRALRVLKLNIPDTLQAGVDTIFHTLQAISSLALLHQDLKKQNEIQHAIQVVTQGRKRADLSSQEDMFMFCESVNKHLPDHPSLHYKHQNFVFVDEVKRLYQDLLTANQDLQAEKEETLAARRKLWKAAAEWDRMYTSLKFAARCVLSSLARTHEYTALFSDLGQRPASSPSSPSTPEPSPEL